MSSALGDIGAAAGLAAGVGGLGGGVDIRPSGSGELPSEGAGRKRGVVDPSPVVGSTRGETGADETVVIGSGTGDVAAGASCAGSGAGDTVHQETALSIKLPQDTMLKCCKLRTTKFT